MFEASLVWCSHIRHPPILAPCKVGCVFPMVFVSILPHADFGPYDDWEDASHFIFIPCHEILAKAFLCYNNSIFDNQCCIFFNQGIFSIITSHNISNINFLIITYWWHCRFLQFSCSSYLIFLCEFTFYYGYIWRKILREVIPLRMDDADDSIKKSVENVQKQHNGAYLTLKTCIHLSRTFGCNLE